MKKIGIIGYGNMGAAIYASIKGKFEVYVYDPFKMGEQKEVSFEKNLFELVEKSEILIVCVKPGLVKEVLGKVHAPRAIFSIAAGVTLASIKNSLADEELQTESKIVRLMPNLPMVVSEGCIGFVGNEEVYSEVYEIFSHLGLVMKVDSEKQLDAITGLSGSGPAFVFSFIQAMAEGGVKSGLSYTDSLQLSIKTVLGSALYLTQELKKGEHPYSLRNKVTSPGGTTIHGLDKLEEGKFNHTVMNAVYGAYLRAKEMGN
ncbi:MAG: pyrroline-5-carboxylate reductase [Leptospiraceae bacterium]|nr:pyrroline-5-carboxylate reductase [Leptospiraceae bacterium]MCP5497623.1 pyrroline-5-carboxylate reductase [Leptospiraceae bacterium]